jgi:hypothetical protein
VTDKPAEKTKAAEPEDLAEPTPPSDVELVPADSGTVVGAVAVRDEDTEADGAVDSGSDKPVKAAQVEYLQGISGTNGFVLNVNGTSYAFNPQMAAALKQAVDQAVVALTL